MPDATATLTTRQVADAAGIKVARVHYLVSKGWITPIHRLPGRTGALLFRRVDVTRLIARLDGDAAGWEMD